MSSLIQGTYYLSGLIVFILNYQHQQGGLKLSNEANESPNLLSPGEVAEMFRVDPKTVTRWAKAGKLSAVKTLGGHRRYHAHEVHELLRKIQAK